MVLSGVGRYAKGNVLHPSPHVRNEGLTLIRFSSLSRPIVAGVSAVSAAILLASCTIPDGGGNADNSADSQQAAAQGDDSGKGKAGAEKVKNLKPKVSVKDGAKNVDPSQPVKVTSENELSVVTMTNENGKVVEEKLSKDGKTWSTDEVLGYNRVYTISAEDEKGGKTTMSFSTPQAAAVAEVALTPIENSTVGVGQTINVNFGQPVPDREKAEELITVETDPGTTGAFYWVNAQEVRWRPQHYWESGTKVKVSVDQYGKSLGGGLYGGSDVSTEFTVGDRLVSIIDNDTKKMTVWKNQKPIRTIPVSLGMDGQWDTPNGRYVIGDMHESLVMDSQTFGLPYDQGGYRTVVDYATQMSYSGIYLHSAPWSVDAQGNTNTSHGCINVTPKAAKWFQSIAKRGDIVKVKNTYGGTLPGTDGLGDWNIPWETWEKGNAS